MIVCNALTPEGGTNKYLNRFDMISNEYRLTASTLTTSASTFYAKGPFQNIPCKTDIFYWLLIMKLKNLIISSARAKWQR